MPALSQNQAHPYKEHGNEIRKNLAETRAVGRQSQDLHERFDSDCLWGLSGPIFDYNDTWQLIINTSTTIITFLMVFLIQNTQNRDTDILHLKIDELLRVNKEAQNAMLGLELLDLKQLEALRKHYRAMGENEVHRTRRPRLQGQAQAEVGRVLSQKTAPDLSHAPFTFNTANP